MNVLFVCNNAFNKGNGITTAIRNTMEGLSKRDIQVRLMAVANPDKDGPWPYYPLEHFVFPIFEPIIRANGFCYAKIDRKAIRTAVRWADVVHLEEALFLEFAVIKIARQEGKPCVATYHLYPHNILANLGFGKKSLLAPLLTKHWNHMVYNRCTDIKCPSREVLEYLKASGTKARLHLIPNGIQIPEKSVAPEPIMPGEVTDILFVGRLSNEKSPETLLEAMRYSTHAGSIRLHFYGKGPKEKNYRALARKLCAEGILRHEPVFGFHEAEDLKALERKAYLYVHCAWVEVEGLSCLEAIREGAVPVIGEGPLIATSAFALCPESLYPERDSRALASRIDWWIEHPEERNRWSAEYAASARRYDLASSMDAFAKMYSLSLGR